MRNYTLAFRSEEELQAAHAAARAAKKSLAQFLRDAVTGGTAGLIARASGGRLTAPQVSFALKTAEGILDGDGFGGIPESDWLRDADRLTGWLRMQPFHPDGAARVAEWWAALPAEVKARMLAACA